jgi:hypothetical protein
MSKPKSIFAPTPIGRVPRNLSIDGELLASFESLRKRLKDSGLPLTLELSDVVERALKETIAAGNRELDERMDQSPTKCQERRPV